ncbi:MAG: response regulator [Deltaproteobacteria bacterium]
MTESQPAKANILLVGAGPELARGVRAALTPGGYQLDVAATGSQALDLAREASFELMLVNADLHDMNVREFCLHCREAEAGQGLPAVILSTVVSPESIQELLAAGAADVLIVPLELPLLLTRVETRLQMLSLQRELARRDALLEKEAATRRQVEDRVVGGSW